MHGEAPLRPPPFLMHVKPDQAVDGVSFCRSGEGEVDSSFGKGWVVVRGMGWRISAQIHDVKQRGDFSAIDVSCLVQHRVNSSFLLRRLAPRQEW